MSDIEFHAWVVPVPIIKPPVTSIEYFWQCVEQEQRQRGKNERNL